MFLKIKQIAFFLLLLLASSDATYQNTNSDDERPHENDMEEKDQPNPSATEPKSSIFPKQLDISTLQNMPLVILHPKTPINFQMLPGENLASLHKSINPHKILELLQSATFNLPVKSFPPNGHESNRHGRDRKYTNPKSQASVNRPQFHDDTPVLPRSLFSGPSNNGWFQRVRGSFSNMLPTIRPFGGGNQFNFGLPSMNLPVFTPFHNSMQGSVNPFMMGSNHQFHFQQPWGNPMAQGNFHMPSMMHGGDLTTGASYMQPTRSFFGNMPLNPFKASPFSQHHFGGGDLAMSGSTFVPHRVPPFGHHPLPRFVPPHQRHKPLFNNVDGLHAASMDISNAFADFTDAKEHGPEVTQKFGNVGHSINTFLKMMGLGATDSFDFGGATGFGGGSSMASMENTPIARSMDFYPGYGNQAHLDDIEDFPIFLEDITEDFAKKVNLTEEDKKKAEKELAKKEILSEVKLKLEAAMAKSKIPKDSKHETVKKDLPYVPAVPFEKVTSFKDVGYSTKPTDQPIVNYNIPSIYSTVAPRDRIPPVAIYQNAKPNGKDSEKPQEYAPAQALPHQEGEANPNKLVDDDEVRQWRIYSGQGYAEKRPVPIVDVIHASMHPESLNVLQKVLNGGITGTM